MQRRRLGKTGPEIGPVALGTMNFTGTYGPATEDQAFRCMSRCLAIGVDHFDTSNVYGMGKAEELLGRFLKQHRGQVTLASKVGITRNPEKPFDNDPAYMRRCLEDSLRRLATDHIELYYVHRREPGRPIEEVVGAMADFVREGKIGAIGLSEVAPATLERAAAVHPIAAVQSEYSLWTRLPDLGMIQACARHGAAFVAFSCLGRAMLTGRAPKPADMTEGDFRLHNPRFSPQNFSHNQIRIAGFVDYCRSLGQPPASVAIAWVLARATHIIALPGSRSADHMAENAAGADVTLSVAQLAEIEAILPVGWAQGPRYNPTQNIGPESYC